MSLAIASLTAGPALASGGLLTRLSAVVPLQPAGGGLLYLAIIFFVLAILAAVVGFQGVAGISMEVARILVLVFLVLAVVALLL